MAAGAADSGEAQTPASAPPPPVPAVPSGTQFLATASHRKPSSHVSTSSQPLRESLQMRNAFTWHEYSPATQGDSSVLTSLFLLQAPSKVAQAAIHAIKYRRCILISSS